MEFNSCPLCGSSSIQKKKGVYNFVIHGKSLSTPIIQYWNCPNCGEVFFDRQANKIIDHALLPHRKQKIEGRSRKKSTARIKTAKRQLA
jgi:YgiT-type zinc finger domain-containing protein